MEIKYYVWNLLPFGLQCSPYYFCKLLRPVIEYLRGCDIRLLAYGDDILICAPDVSIFKHVKHVLDTLTSLGFQINHEKSCLEPGHVQDYLGYVIDTSGESVILKVPKTRIKKIRSDIRRALSKETIGARTLARIIGQYVATTKAVLPGKLKLRSGYRLLHTKSSWDSLLPWSAAAKSDFLWWIDMCTCD